mmetsp:Transcript_129457/g.360595  ORF Transcript_129457/g.360595 Transcript_129457/m.360595 type:complete len:430 (+) Transcript_129457:65-1354(+)
MSLFAAPLEESEIAEIQAKFPDFDGEPPDEAKYWSRSDLELFFGSNGQLKPRETAKAGAPASALLSRLRQRLAEDGVDEAPAEYRSFCRHLRERAEAVHRLPGTAECTEVPRVDKAPALLKAPLLTRSPKDWAGRQFGLDFWRREYSGEWWKFRARAPSFENDKKGADKLAMQGTVAEYVDYVRVLQKMDPSCLEENAVAYPRVSCDSWCPFVGAARSRFETCWRGLRPAGVKDLSVRWMKLFAATFNMDWLEFSARYFKVTLAAPGSISRLHKENHAAHVWFTQIEGKRLFFSFSPKDAQCLYEESGAQGDEGPEGYAACASPVDIFFPSQKRHPRFSTVKAQAAVLEPGDTLVLPTGWWYCSVALTPSVTMHHPFWNLENRTHLVPELKEAFDEKQMPPELKELSSRHFAALHEHILDDEDSDMEDN